MSKHQKNLNFEMFKIMLFSYFLVLWPILTHSSKSSINKEYETVTEKNRGLSKNLTEQVTNQKLNTSSIILKSGK